MGARSTRCGGSWTRSPDSSTARRPARLVACWDDDWRPAFRVAAIPSYKEHRLAADGGEEVPAGLTAQVPVIVEAARGVRAYARVGAPGAEADDVIGTLATRERGRPGAPGCRWRSSPGTVTCSSSSTTPGRYGSSTPRAAWGASTVVDQATSRATYGVAHGRRLRRHGDPAG